MHEWPRALLAASLGLALGACSFTPDYRQPEPPVPASWPEDVRMPAGTVQGLGWESFFPDVRLQALIRAALQHNRDLRMASARVAEARALYGVQRADRLPTVAAGVAGSAVRTPADLSTTGSAVISRRTDVNVSLLSFELDFWGRVAALSEAARASYLAAEHAQRAFRLSLVASVADAYLGLLEAQERLALAQAALQSRLQTRELVQHRRAAGLAGDQDFLQADAAYEGARAEVAAWQRQQAAARNYLRALVGDDPADLPPGRTLQELDFASIGQPGLPSQVLLRRPDVLAAEERLRAAHANVGAARAAFFPRITLTAAAGTASRELSGLFKDGSEAWSLAPSLSLPLFDAGRNRAGLELAQARQDIAVADYERTLQQAFREVADLLAAREQLAEQLQSAQAQLQAQQRATDIALARYRQGVGSFLEVLDAQRQLLAAQHNLIQLRRSQGAAAAQLYKALGGES
jgi:multidrug efflux system outer membrane protein